MDVDVRVSRQFARTHELTGLDGETLQEVRGIGTDVLGDPALEEPGRVLLVLHAVFRQNAGCTQLIVGRDHAGVGSYYGPFDAQTIFEEEVPKGALGIEIFNADHTAFSKKLGKVVMMRDAPDHSNDDFVLLSGTKVREVLAAGKDLPEEFARPEVARILMDHYKSEA